MEERYYDSSSDEMAEEDLQEEPISGARKRKKSMSVSTLLIAVIGAALVVVVMVAVWFWERPQGQRPAKSLKLLENRIAQLEERIAKLNGVNKRVMTLESQGQKFMTAVDRIDRFESAITLRMDIVAKELSELQQAAAGSSSQENKPPARSAKIEPLSKPTAPLSEISEESALHTVSAGETLYSISRRYGMSVDELRRSNQLDEKATIYPGQQLKVQ